MGGNTKIASEYVATNIKNQISDISSQAKTSFNKDNDNNKVVLEKLIELALKFIDSISNLENSLKP